MPSGPLNRTMNDEEGKRSLRALKSNITIDIPAKDPQAHHTWLLGSKSSRLCEVWDSKRTKSNIRTQEMFLILRKRTCTDFPNKKRNVEGNQNADRRVYTGASL